MKSPSMNAQRVIVTGAAQGMGRAHCQELARRGALVTALDRDVQALRETEQLVGPDQLLGLECDVSDRHAVKVAITASAERFGGVDAVVSNAGTINTFEGLADTDDDDWDRTMAVHVGGARNLCRAALPWLVKSEAPRIVIVSSMWAQRGPGYGYAYCAAKGALLAFAKNLAVELGPAGILVNAIAPGSVQTRMVEGFTDQEVADDLATIPMARWSRPEEISRLVCFLASGEASYLTGQTVAINGGQVIASF